MGIAAEFSPISRRALASDNRAALLPGSSRNVCSYSTDRKSTRLNSSHLVISYAVFCLKKKKIEKIDEALMIQMDKVNPVGGCGRGLYVDASDISVVAEVDVRRGSGGLIEADHGCRYVS